MNEIINKYMWKHLRIEGNIIYVPTFDYDNFVSDVDEIFDIENFCLLQWISSHIGEEYITIYLNGQIFFNDPIQDFIIYRYAFDKYLESEGKVNPINDIQICYFKNLFIYLYNLIINIRKL